MRARYAGKWYRTLTFVQNNSEYHPDSTVTHSLWREWLGAPGKLRIEFQLADSGSGIIFARDSQVVITNDSITMSRPFIHPLLVLGVDGHDQPLDRTLPS